MMIESRSHPAPLRSHAPHLFAALVCAATLAFSGMASGESREPLGEGDSVRIVVFQNPDLTTETRVSERGTITFPMVGEVKVAGMSPVEAEARIAKALADGKFVLKPQVNLNVTKVRSRQVTVLGQVARPGRYALEDPTATVTDILALAGGITQTGDENITVVSREGKSRVVDLKKMVNSGDLTSNIQLGNGDTVYVQAAPVFYIYGEVQRAGAYKLEPVMTVMQAIAVGGGITPRGTERGLRIRRKAADGHFQVLDAGITDSLAPGDVVYVRESLF